MKNHTVMHESTSAISVKFSDSMYSTSIITASGSLLKASFSFNCKLLLAVIALQPLPFCKTVFAIFPSEGGTTLRSFRALSDIFLLKKKENKMPLESDYI